MAKVTIEDISRHTGLSRGTVSRALNDRPDISEQTKQRVLRACRELKYVPSQAARSLATGRRYAVAVVVGDLRCGFAHRFLRGVSGRARVDRYAIHVSELGCEIDSTLEHLASLVSERVDAVLLAGSLTPEAARRLAAVVGECPLVAGVPLEGVACDVLAPDYAEAGRLVAQHLLGNTWAAGGILYAHDPGSEGAERRRAGFHQACEKAGVEPQEVSLPALDQVRGEGERLGPLRARLNGTRAIVCSDDFLAIEAMMLCWQVGRVPGRDIAVMGQGNEPIGTYVCPSLTTVDYCVEEIGQRAMEVALQRIMKLRRDAPQQTLVPPLLIPRNSTRPST